MVHNRYPHLLSPLDIGVMELPNRVIMGSMHTGLEKTGNWDRLAKYYRERILGGVGLIITGGIAPNREGAVFPNAASLCSLEEVKGHQIVTSHIHDCGGKIAMQILHAGRYAYGEDCVAPSPIKSPISPYVPTMLSDEGIEKQISDITATAVRACEAGYDGVEIMGSEGYFINQFLVAQTNRRSDRWGGSYCNRMRLPVEIVRKVRKATGNDFLIIYRLSVIDLIPNGSNWAEVETLAIEISNSGANVINTGIGWHESRIPTIATSVPRKAFAWVAKKLMGVVDTPIVASNRINSPEVAEELLANEYCDLVSMARPMLADAEFVNKVKVGKSHLITPCIACNQACLDHTFDGKVSTCLVNPRACHETDLNYERSNIEKSIAIVGAGPAGLSCALVAARRGHQVTVFEQSYEIGGQLKMARQIPGKEEFHGLIQWYKAMLDELKINVVLNAIVDIVQLEQYDEIVIATGALPRQPDIPGIGGSNVLNYAELLTNNCAVGERVTIIGAGGIGFDVAEYLASGGKSSINNLDEWLTNWGVADPEFYRGGLNPAGPKKIVPKRQVLLIQRKKERLGHRLGKTTGWIHRSALRHKHVIMRGGTVYLSIEPRGLKVLQENGDGEEIIESDTIIICAGQQSNRRLADKLATAGKSSHIIGGADHVAELNAKNAINQGVRLAATI